VSILKNKTLEIYTDGASQGNPGPSAYAFIFVIDKEVVYQQTQFIGHQTNNQAEYRAIIEALTKARKKTNQNIIVYSDSELVIKQLKGDYQVRKKHLAVLFDKVLNFSKYFKNIEFNHVPRTNKWIKIADRLCNSSLKEKNSSSI
jgi:ribonuclease HI